MYIPRRKCPSCGKGYNPWKEYIMPVNKVYLREQMIFTFGVFPLTDDEVDAIDITHYSGLDTLVDIQRYMRDDLGLPYTDEYQAMVDKMDKSTG